MLKWAFKEGNMVMVCVCVKSRMETRIQFVLIVLLFSCSNHKHKVIIVGLDNAGKTTILYQFLMNEVVHTSPTIGSNVEEVQWKNIHFLMWDIGGQETLRTAWPTYYENTEFLIFVIDSTDRERLHITKSEMYNMLANEELRHSSVLIFANKQDIKGSMSAAELSEQLNLTSIRDHGWHIQACCALSGEGFRRLLTVDGCRCVDLTSCIKDLSGWFSR